MYKYNKFIQGSISILAAILVLSISFLSLGLAYFIKAIRIESQLDRLMDLEKDLVLANFDRELYERYGLFALESSAEYANLFNQLTAAEELDARVDISFKENLDESDNFKTMLYEFTAPRLPLRLVNEIDERSGFIDTLVDKLQGSLAKMKGNLGKLSKNLSKLKDLSSEDTAELQSNPSGAHAGRLRYMPQSLLLLDNKTETKDSAESEQPEEDPEMGEEEARTNLNDFLDEIDSITKISNELGAEASSEEISEAENPFTVIIDVISNLEKILSSDKNLILEKIYTSEYILNQCSSRTRGPLSEDNEDFITLSGISMEELSFSSDYEAEMAIIGTTSEKTAKYTTASLIFILRALSNYISNRQDPKTFGIKQALGLLISTAIAVLSAGTIVLSPEFIAECLLIFSALRQAYKDYKELKSGGKVQLYPAAHLIENKFQAFLSVENTYIDYLRFISLFIPLSKQLNSLRKIILENTQVELYTAFEIRLNYINQAFKRARISEYSYV